MNKKAFQSIANRLLSACPEGRGLYRGDQQSQGPVQGPWSKPSSRGQGGVEPCKRRTDMTENIFVVAGGKNFKPNCCRHFASLQYFYNSFTVIPEPKTTTESNLPQERKKTVDEYSQELYAPYGRVWSCPVHDQRRTVCPRVRRGAGVC